MAGSAEFVIPANAGIQWLCVAGRSRGAGPRLRRM